MSINEYTNFVALKLFRFPDVNIVHCTVQYTSHLPMGDVVHKHTSSLFALFCEKSG